MSASWRPNAADMRDAAIVGPRVPPAPVEPAIRAQSQPAAAARIAMVANLSRAKPPGSRIFPISGTAFYLHGSTPRFRRPHCKVFGPLARQSTSRQAVHENPYPAAKRRNAEGARILLCGLKISAFSAHETVPEPHTGRANRPTGPSGTGGAGEGNQRLVRTGQTPPPRRLVNQPLSALRSPRTAASDAATGRDLQPCH